MDYQTLPIGRLLLDTDNPRHEPVVAQREAILALIAVERQKLVVLATDIRDYGLSPLDRMLVVKEGRNFTVVEGNRRLAAIKLLDNPGLADDTPISAQIRRVAKGARVPSQVDCAVAPDRKDAAHWMELRHQGEASGAGVVRWNTLATHRFSQKPGTQAAQAITFLESAEAGYPDNEVIQDLIQRVAAKRLTTLGRLVADPNFKSLVGLVEQDGRMLFDFPAAALQQTLEHILGDIGADVTVSQLKNKEQRSTYLGSVPKPKAKDRMGEPQPLSDAPAPKSQPTKRPRRRPRRDKPFKDLDVSKLGAKTQAIIDEFRRLDVEKMPNASALVIRAILELSVDEFIRKKSLSSQGNLRQRVRTCLREVDPTQKADEYKGVRAGLADGNSIYSVSTLHAFVHNRHYHADGATVRSIASNLHPFLQAMNDLA